MSPRDSDPRRSGTTPGVRKGRRGVRSLQLAALVAVSLTVAFVLCEAGLRAAFPPHRFLNPSQDCFWSLRLRHLVRDEADERRLYGSGQHDARIGWKPQADLRSAARNTNSRGIRGVREYAYEKPQGVLRLVVHGDSFTWGLGVRDSETYSSRLATLLPGSETINMGINGHGIDQQYLYWLAEGMRYETDIVVLGFFVADFHRSALTVREFPKPWFVVEDAGCRLAGIPVPTAREYLQSAPTDCRSASRVADLAAAVLRRTRRREPADSFRHKAALTRAILARWSESLAGTSAELCLLVIPHPRYREYPDHARIEELLEGSARENGFAFLNLTDALQAFEKAGASAYLAGNGHWSPAGHAFAAEQIAAFLGTARPFRLTHD